MSELDSSIIHQTKLGVVTSLLHNRCAFIRNTVSIGIDSIPA
jgi:hypothetical protein